MDYSKSHMRIRRLYGKARFDIDISEFEPKNPYGAFERLCKRNFPQKTYSLHRVPKLASAGGGEALLQDALSYVRESRERDRTPVAGEWCDYCTHRGNCLEPYLKEL